MEVCSAHYDCRITHNLHKTEIGKIAGTLAKGAGRKKTPLQVKLDYLAYVLFGLAVIFGLIVFAANGWDFSNDMVLYAISVGT